MSGDDDETEQSAILQHRAACSLSPLPSEYALALAQPAIGTR